MSKRFSKKNAQKYVVVHRPHDDPHFYDEGASAHVLVPVDSHGKINDTAPTNRPIPDKSQERVGEAALYGINFDDSKYDYTQHLKPIGEDPSNSIFIPAKGTNDTAERSNKKNIEDLFVEPKYQEVDNISSVFQRGVAKPEYLIHQQDVPDDIKGFKPDMNPALREVLEALEDEAYVINDDIVVESKKNQKPADGEDDIFAELLCSGEAEDEEQFEGNLDEWDIDNLEGYEEEHYREELENIDNVENFEDLKDIDYQADVKRFQQQQKQWQKRAGSDADSNAEDLESVQPDSELEDDVLGDLPTFGAKPDSKVGSKKRKERKKKGAMSDISGFSMSSSAIARTETMTILDDKYDHIISGYDNYKEEQEEDFEENYQLFDMKKERSDFESLLDDFLDNYELDQGGRKLYKKDEEIDRLKMAADQVSKGKLSKRRNQERLAKQKNKDVKKVASSLSNLKL